MSKRRQRVQNEPAYVLHNSAWRETSLLLQVFTPHYGILPLVAKGAKRPYSALRSVLSVFQPLSLSWSGAGEIKTLTQADTRGIHALSGRTLMSAWYLNELLIRLVPREDPHEQLFATYARCLHALAQTPNQLPYRLREFEWVLLQEIGYGLDQRTPDFNDPELEPYLRTLLRERIDEQLGRALRTREVLMDLRLYHG